MKTSTRHPLITGTFLLTCTGLTSRFIGFFYRIFLSRTMGEEGMGLYQLMTPVLSVSLSLCAAGYQNSISKLVAERTNGKKDSVLPLLSGLSIALPLSLLCNLIVYHFSSKIAVIFLGDARVASLLRIGSFSIPLSTVHACINGYFYGRRRALVPATAQITEQLSRVGFILLLSQGYLKKGAPVPVSVAALGLTLGEFISMGVTLLALLRVHKSKPVQGLPPREPFCGLYPELLSLALPLTANRIVLNLLQSLEAVSIPARLRLYGLDANTSLSLYGVLTGMALPFIFFPNALTGSLAILLLPTVSESHAARDIASIRAATRKTFFCCGGLGLLCMLTFVCLGRQIGLLVFDSPLAGDLLSLLGFVCPFLYLDTTLSAILQGLGKVRQLFLMNILSLSLRLLFVFYLIPIYGIKAYLWGILTGQLTQCALYSLCLHRTLNHSCT